VPDALRQVFKSDGMQVVITFAKRTSLNSRLGSKPSSPGVQALVLPVSWEELVARVGSVLDHSRTKSNVARFSDVRIDFSSMKSTDRQANKLP
jgi:DNA-binding response OmpR family regulator